MPDRSPETQLGTASSSPAKEKKQDKALDAVPGDSEVEYRCRRELRLTLDRAQDEPPDATRRDAELQQLQKMEAVGRLAGGIAHDFNNLLTVISGYSNLLLRRLGPNDPASQLVTEILNAGDRAAELSRQLLVLSRRQAVQLRDFNLNDVVQEVEAMLSRVIGEDIRLESVLSRDLGLVHADPGQFHQILMNMATNARDAMPTGGVVRFETRNIFLDEDFAGQHPEVTAGPHVELMVSDTGCGMTTEVMSHLYEPFYTTKGPSKGTGLGLATVYGIVKQNGGSIWVQSAPGKGTSFKIYLPRVEARAQADKPEHRRLDPRGTETILVVDDQEQLRQMVARVLREYGYRVLEAAGPEEALRHAEQSPCQIHLLLSDVAMPVMSGWKLAEHLSSSQPNMATIFMSGYGDDANQVQASCPGGAYLAKPFSPAAVAAKVREILGPSGRSLTQAPAPMPAESRIPRILVADDDSAVRKFFRDVLESEGYQVVEAANGTQALHQVRAEEPNIVISDLVMPDCAGVDTIRALRTEGREIGIIAITGGFGAHFLRTASMLGADGVLSKPVSPEHLREKVADVLRMAAVRRSSQAAVELGNLPLNC